MLSAFDCCAACLTLQDKHSGRLTKPEQSLIPCRCWELKPLGAPGDPVANAVL